MDFAEFLTRYQKTSADFSLDVFLNGRLRLSQPVTGMRAGSDALFIGLFAGQSGAKKILEIGCGSGCAALAAAILNPTATLTGLELQAEYADLARYNIAEHQLTNRCAVITGDLQEISRLLPPDSFDCVISNPPFYAPNASRPAKDGGKKIAFQENMSLIEWVRKSLYALKNFGHAAFIFRTERLAEIFAALDRRAGDLMIFPLQSKASLPAKRTLLICKKAGKGGTKIMPSIILHEENGDPTPAAQALFGGEGKNFFR